MKTLISRQVRLVSLTAVAMGLATLVSTPSQAAAAANRQTSSVTVHYGDLNLSKPRDVDTLYIRLHNSAKDVCGDDEDVVELWKLDTIARCEQQAMANAVATIHRPMLTALYDKRYPHEMLAPVAMALPMRVSTSTLDLLAGNDGIEMPS